MKGQERIDELWAYVIVDDDGTEGVPAFLAPTGMWAPLMGADGDRMKSLRSEAKKIANIKQAPVELLRFTGRESMGSIRPSKPSGRATPKKDRTAGSFATAARAVSHAAPASKGPDVPYRTFDEPEIGEGYVMDNVIVAATLVDGQPGIGVIFIKDGKAMPAFTLVGKLAEDLPELARKALEGAKRTQN